MAVIPDLETAMHHPVKGFTLIEALVVMGAVAILLVIAVPAWSHAKAAAASGAVRTSLTTSMLDAVRHSAIAGAEVVICPVTTEHCDDSTSWDQGWIVFADINGNRIVDANETRIDEVKPLPEDVHLRSTIGRRRIIFQPNGGNAGSNVTFTLCDSRGVTSATTLVLANDGNLRAGKPTAAAAWECVQTQ
jgi:type IV fimbrial biogenesis protein FimT